VASFLLVSKGITGVSILQGKSFWWPSKIHPPKDGEADASLQSDSKEAATV
jgi:hypothetical protein